MTFSDDFSLSCDPVKSISFETYSRYKFETDAAGNDTFMPPTSSKKLRRHIGFGLSLRLCVTLALGQEPFIYRILKFGMWNEYEN